VNNLLYLAISSGIIAMLFAFWKTSWINKQDQGTKKMERIGQDISDGAMAFLKAEYRVLAIFVFVVALLLGFANYNKDGSSFASCTIFLLLAH
jgi:Inorganic pyrophosphatase